MFGCFWFLEAWLLSTFVCFAGQQKTKSHCTETWSATGAEENILASHSITPGKVSSEEEESFLKKGDDNFIFLWKTLSSVSRTSTDLRQFLSLAFPGNLHCTTDATLPLYFWNYSSLLHNYSCLHFWKLINMLVNAALCLSNPKIRKAASSGDQTTNPRGCHAAEKGLWNTAVILDSYHLGETFGTFVHQIYPPCSADHVQPSKCSLGI